MAEEKTKIERIVKGERPEWVKKYEKDGIVVYGDPIFGRVKLITPKGMAIDDNMAAVGGIVAFGEQYKGIGGLIPYMPYVPINVMDALRGE